MKKQLFPILCGLAVAVIFGCQPAHAQLATTNPPTSFFASVGSYLTSSDTNLPAQSTAELRLGMEYQGGVNIASTVGLRYKFGGTNTSGFFAEETTENGGVGGIIISQTVGGGYYIDRADIELSAGIYGGYRFDTSNGDVGGFVEALKMMTPNTFSGARLGVDYSGNATASRVPTFELFTGFKF